MTATVVPLRPAPLQLTAGQLAAQDVIRRVARAGATLAPFGTISGFAGTGKTTLLKVVTDLQPVLLAPTGKAALRLQEATGREAVTIHRAIYSPLEDAKGNVKFVQRGAAVPSDCKVILVDESSMVDQKLSEDLLAEAQRLGLPVVFIGDPFQLPPVAPPGSAPFSVLKLPTAHRAELTEVLRQALDNPIIAASMKIREGACEEGLRAFEVVPRSQLVTAAVGTYQAGGVVIAHRNATRHAMNLAMRRALGFEHLSPRVDEPLLVNRNEHRLELYNGQVVRFAGWACLPERIELERRTVHVGVAELEGTGRAFLCLEDLSGLLGPELQRELGLELASRCIPEISPRPLPYLRANWGYVLTAHKSQGSEWNDVFVLVEQSIDLDRLDGRQWLYTAVTRARERVRIAWGTVK